MPRAIAAAWVYDEDAHRQANAEQENHWDLYIGEACAQLGLTADVVPPAYLTRADLGRYTVLLMGGLDGRQLPAATGAALGRWVERGGLLLAFNTLGLDGLFGIRGEAELAQPASHFSQAGAISLRDHPLCRGLQPDLHPDQPLIAYGPLRRVRAADAEVLADLRAPRGEALGAAVTLRRLGEGYAAYFAFALPQTLWALHQGRPIDRDYDGDGYFRTGDSFVIGDNEIEVPYADHLVWLLESIVSLQPLPLIYVLPPVDSRAATALYYWAGDDEFAAGDQVKASNYMRSVGLPYHINIMWRDGKFSLSSQEADILAANGHDFSLHYNFVPASGFRSGTEFAAEDVHQQADDFFAHFGCRPYANVNHWLRWTGYAEPARWMAEVGGRGDGSFVHARMPPLDPCDIFGYPFGTSFPFRFYEDWRRGNERLGFAEKPLTGYEMGYNQEGNDFTQLHRLMDLTQRRHLMTSMFFHSNRIANIPNCRRAIEEVLRYADEKGVVCKHLSLNGVIRWWFARLTSAVTDVSSEERGLRMHVRAEWEEGLVLRLPLAGRLARSASCDGQALVFEVWGERGQSWLMLPVPPGEHEVLIGWE